MGFERSGKQPAGASHAADDRMVLEQPGLEGRRQAQQIGNRCADSRERDQGCSKIDQNQGPGGRKASVVVFKYEKPERVIQGFPEARIMEFPRKMSHADPDHERDGNDPERHLVFDFQSSDHDLCHLTDARLYLRVSVSLFRIFLPLVDIQPTLRSHRLAAGGSSSLLWKVSASEVRVAPGSVTQSGGCVRGTAFNIGTRNRAL